MINLGLTCVVFKEHLLEFEPKNPLLVHLIQGPIHIIPQTAHFYILFIFTYIYIYMHAYIYMHTYILNIILLECLKNIHYFNK